MPRGFRFFAVIVITLLVLALTTLALARKERKLCTEILIDAPPDAVWRTLTATRAYPDWNPFIVSLRGTLAAGQKLDVTTRPPGGNEMSFTPVVLAVKSGSELAWRGDLFLPGIFTSEHRFRLEPAGEGRTKFLQSEKFTGLLIGPLTNSLLDRTALGFAEMNLAIKIQTEMRQ